MKSPEYDNHKWYHSGDFMFSFLLEILVLVTALSVDAFAAGFSYGVSKIKVPFLSVLIVAGVSSLTLAGSMLAGNMISSLIPGGLTRQFSFLMLFVIGIVKLFDRSRSDAAEAANKNQDDLVSPGEALMLGAALSLDSIAAGIGAGVAVSRVPAAIAASALVGVLAMVSGSSLGRLISSHCRSNLCWVSGLLLILLALMKLM